LVGYAVCSGNTGWTAEGGEHNHQPTRPSSLSL